MNARARALRPALAALSVLAAGGCKPEDLGDALRTQCSGGHHGDELDGEWQLTARGSRHDCDDHAFDGELVIETSMPIEVRAVARASVPDASIVGSEYALELGPGAPDGLRLEGTSEGSCVTFTLTEALADEELVYDFDGALTGPRLAEGDFQGRGPAGCRVDGSFVLETR